MPRHLLPDTEVSTFVERPGTAALRSDLCLAAKADILIAQERCESVPAIAEHLRDSGFGVASAREEQVPVLVRIHSFDAFLIAANDPTRIVRICRRLRNQLRVTAPVIAIGASELRSKLAAFGAGVDDYLVEPVALPELELRLTNRIRKVRTRPKSPTLIVRGLILDPQTRRVSYGPHHVVLSPMEFRLLHLLMREAPCAVSRQQMEWELWRDDPPSGTAPLRGLAYRIRKQLKGIGSPLVIESLPAYACRLR